MPGPAHAPGPPLASGQGMWLSLPYVPGRLVIEVSGTEPGQPAQPGIPPPGRHALASPFATQRRYGMTDLWPLQSFLELGALPGAVPCARLHTRQMLWEWRLTALTDSTELVVSELVTNAVQASRATGQAAPVRLWLLSDTAQILILVWDASSHPPVRADISDDTENGRGLLLVEAISDQWGCYFPADHGGKSPWDQHGKVVWAVVGLSVGHMSHEHGIDPAAVLVELAERVVIAFTADGEIRAAYPFSPAPTPRAPDEVAALLRAVPDVEWDADGRVAGFGMTLNPTPHRVEVGGHRLYFMVRGHPRCCGSSTGRDQVTMTGQRIAGLMGTREKLVILRERAQRFAAGVCDCGFIWHATRRWPGQAADSRTRPGGHAPTSPAAA
jgi:anti-sigma regulatory factor (Ser/Thr protein kinase)